MLRVIILIVSVQSVFIQSFVMLMLAKLCSYSECHYGLSYYAQCRGAKIRLNKLACFEIIKRFSNLYQCWVRR